LFSDKNIRKDMVEYEKAIRACNTTSSMNSSSCKELIDLKLILWGIYSQNFKTKKPFDRPEKKSLTKEEVRRKAHTDKFRKKRRN